MFVSSLQLINLKYIHEQFRQPSRILTTWAWSILSHPSPYHSQEHQSSSLSHMMVAACSAHPATVIFWFRMATTLEAVHAATISLARWAPSVLSLFCHRRCIIPPRPATLRSPLHCLASLPRRSRLQRQLWPLRSHPVAATMCLFLMLRSRILRRCCNSLGSSRNFLCFHVAAELLIAGSGDGWDLGRCLCTWWFRLWSRALYKSKWHVKSCLREDGGGGCCADCLAD